jgi:hypothetical protein
MRRGEREGRSKTRPHTLKIQALPMPVLLLNLAHMSARMGGAQPPRLLFLGFLPCVGRVTQVSRTPRRAKGLYLPLQLMTTG